MDLLHTYNDMAGRICKMWRDYSYTVRPYVLTVEAGGRKLCGTYRTQEEAEHAAAHFMATGDLPKPETAQKPREGVDGVPGAVSTHGAPETHFATPLQRQETPAAANRPTHSDKS